MTETTTIDGIGRSRSVGESPYAMARGLAALPLGQAVASLRGALALSPGDADLNALRLWLALRRHRAGAATLRAVNRLLAVTPLLDRPLNAEGAFAACVATRSAALGQGDPGLFFRLATLSHACGLIAFWRRFGQPVMVEHQGDRYALQVGDRRVVFDVMGPELGLHFDFFFVHEPGMWRWLAELTPADVLLDVGANVGTYSVAAAGLSGCTVVGLEPFPVNLRAAVANVAANGLADRVRILPVAAAASSGQGRLSHEAAVPGVAAQSYRAGGEAAPVGVAEIDVAGVAIDDLVASGTIPFPTRIKIDVDGGEDAVVAGMQRTLGDPRLHSVRMEVRWWEPGKRAVVEAVTRHGFQSAVADDRKNLLFRRVGTTG